MSDQFTLKSLIWDEGVDEFGKFLESVYPGEKLGPRLDLIQRIHRTMPGRDRLPIRNLVMDGTRVAGSMGNLPGEASIDGDRVPMRFTHDLLVDSRYRGKGLAKLLVEAARRSGEFYLGGLWMTYPCYKLHLACGFDAMSEVQTFNLVLDPSAFLESKDWSWPKKRVAHAALEFQKSRARRATRGEIEAAGPKKPVPSERFAAADDDTWAEMCGGYGVAAIRTAEYLNWKYADHPVLPYRIMLAGGGGDRAGYMIWRPSLESDSSSRATVTDFLVRRGDQETFRSLIASVVAECSSANEAALSIITTQSWAKKTLKSFGFVAKPETNTWVVAGWRDLIEPAWLQDHDRWHLCLGDSDGDYWTGTR